MSSDVHTSSLSSFVDSHANKLKGNVLRSTCADMRSVGESGKQPHQFRKSKGGEWWKGIVKADPRWWGTMLMFVV